MRLRKKSTNSCSEATLRSQLSTEILVKSVKSNLWRRFSPLNLVIIQFNEHFIETFLDQCFRFWCHIFWKFTTKFSINVLKILSYQKFKSVSSDIVFALFLLNLVDPVLKPQETLLNVKHLCFIIGRATFIDNRWQVEMSMMGVGYG